MSPLSTSYQVAPPVSPALRRQGTALLDEQMWCWGCDVRAADGNWLVAYGFERRPSPDGRENSAYTYRTSPQSSLTLWGFALIYADARFGSVLLRRHRFDPRFTDEAHLTPTLWRPAHLPVFQRPSTADAEARCRRLLGVALYEIAAYERWLGEHTAPDYRQAAVHGWPQRRRLKGAPAAELPNAWLTLADQVTAVSHAST